MKEPIGFNKKTKIIGAISILVFIAAMVVCSLFKLWYIPLIIGVVLFMIFSVLDTLVKDTMRRINEKNKELIDGNKDNLKMGKISLKDYLKVMKGEGIILEDGTPITKKDIKD